MSSTRYFANSETDVHVQRMPRLTKFNKTQ